MRSGEEICGLCGEKIDADYPDQLIWHEVIGWEGTRDRGSNAAKLRERTGRIAHQQCVDLQRRGLLKQDGLF